ncbi:hypothetical protein K431DRAFT_316861 [Polychaeton citri CBS 116435]|uniref:Eisosome protein 1 n=1 Tax=Polychaeton citri CBS 116435 TaxID=1314669 RepID=A0A9P4UKJ4_9PEZI|nr:hypothetical protein K431DRAFT_316861 [Polychaeton citri CBS 116435]
MAADTSSVATAGEQMACPDPSVHEKNHKLSEQASSAALYVTHPERQSQRESVLGNDGKLSSRSAAASLKYARAQDLPSYPSHGVNTLTSAGQAANVAKDYKMKDLWQPGLSSAGSKAALIAHQGGGKVDLWQPTASEAGNSAAVLAMRNQKSVELDRGYTADGRNKALLAATKSHHDGRRRAGSTPTTVHPAYPDSHNSAFNALNAATVSHRQGTIKRPEPDSNRIGSEAMEAARIKNSHMDPKMFTEHPDVDIEVEDRKRQAALRASAVSMAKDMYDYNTRTTSTTGDGGAAAGAGFAQKNAPVGTVEKDLKQEAMRYIHLQEAAHKLANERLAKVEKEFEYRRKMEYYGYDTQPKRSRLSMRGRNRSASDPPERDSDNSDSEDERQARRVRSQMAQLNTQVSGVDAQKQQKDRALLLAAAQKKVQDHMSTLDKKVYADTGKVSDSMLEEWESKARAKAETEKEDRVKNHGKTHIGGGKYMDQSAIEAIALARLKPTLNELDKNAEEKRARDEETRLEKEAQEREKNDKKQKGRDEKAEAKQIKSEEKEKARQEKAQRKAAEKQEKDADKARKLDEKAKAKEDKRRSKDTKKDVEGATTVAAGAAGAVAAAGAVGATEASDQVVPSIEEPPAEASGSTAPRRANLERHISHISTSSSESESESEESEDESAASPMQTKSIEEKPAVIGAGTAGTAGGILPTLSSGSKVEKETIKKEESEPEPESPRKSRVRGIFSKLGRGRSKSEREPGKIISDPKQSSAAEEPSSAVVVSSSSNPRPSESTVDPRKSVDTSDHVGIDGPIGDNRHVSGMNGNPGASSPSSFARRDRSLSPVSSLSSSGVEEDDFDEGKTGRMKRAFGLGRKKSTKEKGKGKEKSVGEEDLPVAVDSQEHAPLEKQISNTTNSDDGNETFEEARDTFDSAASPQPAFAGQKKHDGEGRETRFHEEM